MLDDRARELRGAEDEIRDLFREAGVRGWLHAVPVGAPSGSASEVGVDPDAPVVMASVYKIIVLIAWCRAVDDGALDPHRMIDCPAAGRTVGPTGLSSLTDDARLSYRDLVTLMITVSDNAAADIVLRTLTAAVPGAVDAVLAAADLHGTRIVGDTDDVHRSLIDDTSAPDIAAAFQALADDDAPAHVRALDPAWGSSTTPREMTRLLVALQLDRLATPGSGGWARSLLTRQIWPHRLRAGFPEQVPIAGKTGTIGPIRNEIGLVTYPGERPVAVAVFTHAARAGHRAPRADAAIGAASRIAVGVLRSGRI